jgi:uncharacterized protein
MSPMTRRTALASSALLLVLQAACSFFGPKPDPSRFFVLTSSVDSGSEPLASPAARSVSLGLGPIHLPDYLKRSTLVVRQSDTQIDPSPVDRWGEPLDKAFPRVLQEDLRRDLGTDRVVLFPWYGSDAPRLQVQIDVLRFDRDADNRASLAARWEVREPGAKVPLVSRESRFTRDASSPRTAAGVEALSATLADLSREIASAVTAVSPSVR